MQSNVDTELENNPLTHILRPNMCWEHPQPQSLTCVP